MLYCDTLHTVAALIDACVIRIGTVPIPLKRAAAILLFGTIQSIDMSATVLVLAARWLLALCCCPNAPESGQIWATMLVVDPGSSSSCVEGHMKGSRSGDGSHHTCLFR
jgi:hypothetical protein